MLQWKMAVSAALLACPHSGTFLAAQHVHPATYSVLFGQGDLRISGQERPVTVIDTIPNARRVLAGPAWNLEKCSGHWKPPA